MRAGLVAAWILIGTVTVVTVAIIAVPFFLGVVGDRRAVSTNVAERRGN